MKHPRLLLLGIIIAAVILIGGFATVILTNNKNTTTTKSKTKDIAAVTMVMIQDSTFGPDTITVKAGTTVTWMNNDAMGHSVTADTASADAPASKLLGKGESYEFTFTKAGTYAYHCLAHSFMHGTVIVTAQ